MKSQKYEELVKRLRNEADCPDNYPEDSNLMREAADAIEELRADKAALNGTVTNLLEQIKDLGKTRWIPVTERLPECDLGAEVGNIEWISCGMVHAGCFGREGKYRDAYFRTWTDAGEGMDAKDADYWRAVTIPQPPKEET